MKILLVANVAKDHVLKFHVPTLKCFSERGWVTDVACGGKEKIPFCRRQYELPIDRSPFKTHFFKGIKQLMLLLDEEKYDVVYCHTEVGGIVARLAAQRARKNGTIVIKLDHGLYFYKGASIINWIIHYPIDKILSYLTDVFILINKEDYEFVSSHFRNSKSYLIDGIGIDFKKFNDQLPSQANRINYRKELGIPQNSFVLIYFAEISKNKNQIFLLRGLLELLKRNY